MIINWLVGLVFLSNVDVVDDFFSLGDLQLYTFEFSLLLEGKQSLIEVLGWFAVATKSKSRMVSALSISFIIIILCLIKIESNVNKNLHS